MKKHPTTLLLACLLLLFWEYSNAQELTFEWVQQAGGEGNDIVIGLSVDAAGNVYTTGHFDGTVDFDPGPGTYELTSNGSWDIFIQKLDASGNLVWVRQMGGTGEDSGFSTVVDVTGNVYTVGYFKAMVDFDPGLGTSNLNSNGGWDIFIQKLNAAGEFVWVKQIGGTGFDYTRAIAVDASGNIYTAGWFENTVDFDPGPETLNLVSEGLWDLFIHKLDASGNLLWVKQMGGTHLDWIYGLDLDSMGNVYTTGRFFGTVDFDPGMNTYSLTSEGDYDIYIHKLDASGNFMWVKQMGGTGNDWGTSLQVDASGNIYTSGQFSGNVDFDPGPGTLELSSNGAEDIFIQKLNVSGDLVWVKQMGGIEEDISYSIAVDASENVYTTGFFNGTVDFNPGANTFELVSNGENDIFIQKLDASGNLIWAGRLGNEESDFSESIAVDALGNVYSAGNFKGSGDFEPGENTEILSSFGEYDIYILKLGIATVSTEALESRSGIRVYPNPTSGLLNIEKGNKPKWDVRVFNSAGQEIIATFSTQAVTSFDLSQYPPGFYLLEVSSDETTILQKIVKQ